MIVAAVIVAAGRGARMGASRPKALLSLGGEPMLARAIRALATRPRVGPVVVVVADPEEARAALGEAAARVTLVRGGPRRQDSVLRGLRALEEADIVLVHDAARPLVPAALVDAVIDAAVEHGAAVPAIAPADTVKTVGEDGVVAGTLARDRLRLAQTPQGFRRELLVAAHARAESDGFLGTDDASLVERIGGRVALIEGSARNIKITTSIDLEHAEALLAVEAAERGRG
jgi:2-C-methyl-D-erythritol 4-phosphate cytidylyltransferase